MAYRWTHCESLALLSALGPCSISGKAVLNIGLLYQLQLLAKYSVRYLP